MFHLRHYFTWVGGVAGQLSWRDDARTRSARELLCVAAWPIGRSKGAAQESLWDAEEDFVWSCNRLWKTGQWQVICHGESLFAVLKQQHLIVIIVWHLLCRWSFICTTVKGTSEWNDIYAGKVSLSKWYYLYVHMTCGRWHRVPLKNVLALLLASLNGVTFWWEQIVHVQTNDAKISICWSFLI